MQDDSRTVSDQPSIILYLRMLVALAVVFVIGLAAFGMMTMRRLDRVVVVVENVNDKIDRAFAAGAPLGKAAVERGTKALEAVDTDDLGSATTEGVKDIGRAAKEKVIEAIKGSRVKKTDDVD